MDFKNVYCYHCNRKPCEHSDTLTYPDEDSHNDHCDGISRSQFLVLPVNHYNTQIFFFCTVNCARYDVAPEVIGDMITLETYENQLLNDYIVGDKE